MKSLVELYVALLQDCGRQCRAPVVRDVNTLLTRVEHEGDSFLTITLPIFCRDFERSLAEGKISPGSFSHFKKCSRTSGMPAFLSGFLSNVFDTSGTLCEHPSVVCIRAIRQICLFAKKVRRPCSSERVRTAAEAYKQVDSEVAVDQSTMLWRWFNEVCQILMSDVLRDFTVDEIVKLMPKHGPGTTQERVTGNRKWRFRKWHMRLELAGLRFRGKVLPPSPIGDPSPMFKGGGRTQDFSHLTKTEFVDSGSEEPVRVTFVPKTQKSPRVIAVEPLCMQFAQQGLDRDLRRRIEKSPLTRGHVNFVRQGVNQELALSASRDGCLATLDMSDASDRVAFEHARALFQTKPIYWDLVEACRSQRARIPGGEVITLRKFASMGSALCFPVEAMVFFASIIASRLLNKGEFPTEQNVHSSGRDVYVYGDDLIVPAAEARTIMIDLESLGFKVNRHKSFWTGKFRESCGLDCYDGEQVTPVYLRSDSPSNRGDATGLLSSVATANQLSQAGYHATAALIKEGVERILGQLPQVPLDSAAVGWTFYSEYDPPIRYNMRLQRAERLVYVPFVPMDPDPLGDYWALAKCLRMVGGPPSAVAADHLSRLPRAYALTLKRRWVGESFGSLRG